MKCFSLAHRAPADPSQTLREAVGHALDFAVQNHLSEPLATRMGIVVEELIANVIRHGAFDGNVAVEAMLGLDEGGVAFILYDDGRVFDPRSHPLPDRPHPVTGGGSGLPLVRAWADINDYRREGERNRLELIIRA